MKHSPPSHNAAPPGGGNSNLLQSNGEPRQTCAHCESEIVDGQWFCRLPAKEAPTLLCCPGCALRHFDRLRPDANGWDEDADFRKHRFHS